MEMGIHADTVDEQYTLVKIKKKEKSIPGTINALMRPENSPTKSRNQKEEQLIKRVATIYIKDDAVSNIINFLMKL